MSLWETSWFPTIKTSCSYLSRLPANKASGGVLLVVGLVRGWRGNHVFGGREQRLVLSDHHRHQVLDLRSRCEERQTPLFLHWQGITAQHVLEVSSQKDSGLNQNRWSYVLTLHHGDRVFYLRFEQVDPHHRGQVLYVHLVHSGVQLHLKQEPAKQKSAGQRPWGMSHDALHSTIYSPADVAEKVVVDSGEDCNLLLQLFPTLCERLNLFCLHVQTRTFFFDWNKIHLCGIGVQRVGAVQEVLVLSPGDHRLRKLTQVQFEQWRHRVDICITAGNDTYTPCKWHAVHTQHCSTTWPACGENTICTFWHVIYKNMEPFH